MVLSIASTKDADIIAVDEPNKGIVGRGRWLSDLRGDAAFLLRNRNIEVRRASAGHILIDLQNLAIICCYISPNVTLEGY